MSKEVTLGGDRIGSGNKQKVELHNFGMNSFNLSQDWKSTMGPGILYPFIKMVGTNHGTFDIDMDTFVRTLPTQGPLFGSFKLQCDLYSVPFRLYQGILHNNPINLGLNMNQVYLPKIKYSTIDGATAPIVEGSTEDTRQFSTSCLSKYLGLSGIGKRAQQQTNAVISRKIQCVPELAYYDIFKCYYSNKQEDNAYVITPGTVTETGVEIEQVIINNKSVNGLDRLITTNDIDDIITITGTRNDGYATSDLYVKFYYNKNWSQNNTRKTELLTSTYIYFFNGQDQYGSDIQSMLDEITDAVIEWKIENDKTLLILHVGMTELAEFLTENISYENGPFKIQIRQEEILTNQYTNSIHLQSFPLENIDEMRNRLLSANTLGQEFIIDEENYNTFYPYAALVNRTEENISWNAFELNGLVVKTYQSDLFNNWLSSEYVDSITELTSVDTTSGSFTMDDLNLSEKIYELLNRVLVGGGTYQDWQEAVYGEGAVKMCETPVYIGGMSAEIMFEEVIATTDNNEIDQALGSLGGKGTQVGKKGGNNIHVKMDEPGYILGIVSLTPRVCYSQGNDWDRTELDTIDDLHKPNLDGIGFQDLIIEQMAWWNTVLNADGEGVLTRSSAGKQTAWINYQTAIDKCFGDFAKEKSRFMVLDRHYEHGETISAVKDITTYIDPTKYNYAFAYADLSAQNFWVQINTKVTARRKMGAQQLPNL